MFNKKTVAFIFLALLGVIVVVGFFVNYVIKDDNLQIYVSPQNAAVKLGDTTIQPNKPLYMEPGTYSLSIQADDFTSLTQNITVSESSFTALAFCLTPSNMSQEEYLKTYEEDRYICEGAAGQAFNKEAAAAIEKYPVIGDLPYEDGTFSIGQGILEEGDGPALYVHYSTEKSYTEAKEWLGRYHSDQIPPTFYIKDYEQLDRIGGKDSQIDKLLLQKYPIIENLPIDAFIYKLGYKIDQSDKSGESIKLTITSDTASGRIAGLREIQALGYDAVDYKIEFLNFENGIR